MPFYFNNLVYLVEICRFLGGYVCDDNVFQSAQHECWLTEKLCKNTSPLVSRCIMQELYNPVTGMHMHSLNMYIFCSIVRVYSPLNPQLHPAAAASSRVLFGRRWRRADVQLTLYCKDGERKERGLGSALFSACRLNLYSPPPVPTHTPWYDLSTVYNMKEDRVLIERENQTETVSAAEVWREIDMSVTPRHRPPPIHPLYCRSAQLALAW